jgi:riboflavin synthase
MFTGIVRERGRVVALDGDADGVVVRIAAPRTAGGVSIGDSVALNGCCLTVVEIDGGELAFNAVPETLRRTSLGRLEAGSEINVEPALRGGDSMGGHYVQGHVDGVGRVRAAEPEGDGVRITFDAPDDVVRYCVEKGSIAVDGVSLTVAAVDAGGFSVALVPHTLSETTLSDLGPGSEVNLEVDVLAKYVERLARRD